MTDLSSQAAHKFWFDYPDPMIYRVVTFMESVEDWTLDGDQDLENAMQQLGVALDDIGQIDLQQEDKFIEVLACLRAARMLRLMQALDTAYPGAASKLLTHAETVSTSSDDTPGLFLRRNVIFERLRLLGRIIAPERITLVTKTLEEEMQNE
jgi:intracellular multiplication protein IcmW